MTQPKGEPNAANTRSRPTDPDAIIKPVPHRGRTVSPAYVRQLRRMGASDYAIEFAERYLKPKPAR